MPEKRVVTCPRCGFRATDQGDVANPSLTADVRAFARSCPLTGDLAWATAERPFNCPDLLKAARHAALAAGLGRTR